MKMLKVTVALLALGCSNEGQNFSSLNEYAHRGIDTLSNNIEHVKSGASDGMDYLEEKYQAAEHKGDLAIEKAKDKGVEVNQWGLEKHEAAKVKLQENGEATERKFHEKKDNTTKAITGSDKAEQSRTDAGQDDRLTALEDALSELQSNVEAGYLALTAAISDMEADLGNDIDAVYNTLLSDMADVADSFSDVSADLEALAIDIDENADSIDSSERRIRILFRKHRNQRSAIQRVARSVCDIETSTVQTRSCHYSRSSGYHRHVNTVETLVCSSGSYELGIQSSKPRCGPPAR